MSYSEIRGKERTAARVAKQGPAAKSKLRQNESDNTCALKDGIFQKIKE